MALAIVRDRPLESRVRSRCVPHRRSTPPDTMHPKPPAAAPRAPNHQNLITNPSLRQAHVLRLPPRDTSPKTDGSPGTHLTPENGAMRTTEEGETSASRGSNLYREGHRREGRRPPTFFRECRPYRGHHPKVRQSPSHYPARQLQ